jgi:hypothetical protein
VDFEVRHVESLVILKPQNDRAEGWAVDNLEEAISYEDGGFAVEPRHLELILMALLQVGFTLNPMPVCAGPTIELRDWCPPARSLSGLWRPETAWLPRCSEPTV